MELKILQINVWTGRIKDGLTRFIAEGDYDIVCMQEASWGKNDCGFLDLYIATVDKIKIKSEYPYDFRSPYYGIELLNGDERLEQGNVILSKIPFESTYEEQILGKYAIAKNNTDFRNAISGHGYNAQKVKFKNGLTMVNYHGYWQSDPIGNETTVKCMAKVANMLKNEQGPIVMCGDLNVTTESPAMRELDFLKDLTAIHDVKTTLRNLRFVKDVACDHILVSDDLDYHDFKVIDTYASDHKALSVVVNI